MRIRIVLLALAVSLAGSARARGEHRRRRAPSTVVLDGVVTTVRWVDGDTFRVLDGANRGRAARLEGYNTLETYGPVHRWGAWTGPELLAIARAATPVAASRTWACSTSGAADRYRRLLVSCPGAAAALVNAGLAMVYAIDVPPDPELLELQREAQRRGRGMWAKGIPEQLVTSVHSAAENAEGGAYDRIVDTRTGHARQRLHARSYRTCEEVCAGSGVNGSCMRYVPFERRYRRRPPCLRTVTADR